MPVFTSSIDIKNERDIVKARQLARECAKQLGFSHIDQIRITTAMSELARNLFLYASNGVIKMELVEKEQKGLKIVSEDQGPGIEDIREALGDGYTTSGGLGAGLPGVKRIMDDFMIRSNVGKGTEIVAVKWAPRREGLSGVIGQSQKF
ncbi:MAG TPA: anti-sigma regulatory factor [Bacillales bacterium]|nr:anti-sigma regulatory factor [Bacillales bacterium]